MRMTVQELLKKLQCVDPLAEVYFVKDGEYLNTSVVKFQVDDGDREVVISEC